MRVMLTKGRIDHEAERVVAREMPGLVGQQPPYFFFSWVIRDLERACRKKGWQVGTLFIGAAKKQRFQRPNILINLITEPLICRRALDRLDAVLDRYQLPVLNPVAAIRRSSRSDLPQALAGQPRTIAPKTTLFVGQIRDLPAHIESAGHRWPVLIRPAGTHGSAGLKKFDTVDPVTSLECPPSGLLVSDFFDFRSGDGLFRKYRMIWVDGKIFRRHLIAGTEWNVTGNARVGMAPRPDLIEAEKEFLASGADDLDRRVGDLFRVVGLDFGVIDFAVSDTGEIIVFELNGTFQISGSIPKEHRERWGYLEGNNAAITDALIDSITHRAQ